MFSSEITIAKARMLIELAGWNKHKLAKKAGLSPNALRSLDSDDYGANTSTLKKLKTAMEKIEHEEGIDLSELLAEKAKEEACPA